MNNALQIFNFNSHDVRVITDTTGEVWFIAKDAAEVLGYGNTKQAVIDHCKKAKSLKDIGVVFRDPEQNQQLTLDMQTKLIPESDVYRLVIRSKLESAEAFQDWLVEQVLPSIRKTGSYSMTGFNVPKTFAEALRLAADAQEKLEAAQAIVEKQQKTISVKDDLIRASNEASIKAGEILIREFVKSVDIINLGEKQFYQWMREQNIIMESREPYSEYVKAGYFTWKPTEIKHGGEYRYTLRVTPRGKVWLAAKYMAYIDTRLSAELFSLVA
ncbi:phage antirepressor [Methylocucumis oryzae]|uniref:phage antirepressor n=1 Tax=Methylocucumis oryzae TaxID=1632867 RepID=UPI000696F7DE|nr:BRO family protein [Methylocucumis oryzae]